MEKENKGLCGYCGNVVDCRAAIRVGDAFPDCGTVEALGWDPDSLCCPVCDHGFLFELPPAVAEAA
jgi:hypothetical protein